MAYKDTNLDWTKLINVSSSGISIATFPEIRNAIVNRFKEVYGPDIDVSTASADGIYIETLSLIINNILQSFKNFYAQLDIRSASGRFLDSLCALSNISRKQATSSTASVILTLDSTASQNYVTKEIVLADKNGNTWIATSLTDLVFEPGVPQQIVVSCTEKGPIVANEGWIDRLVSNDVVMTIKQPKSAAIGSYIESDASLKSRRNEVLGASGITVLESLAGELLSLTGIDDVRIYNNNTTSSITAKDGTILPVHTVYIILRQKENIELTNQVIGSAIYEKMTPGIQTVQTEDETEGVSQSFKYIQYILGVPTEANIDQNTYWKKAKPVSPKITITIIPNQYYAGKNNSTANKIANNVIDYMSKVHLSDDVHVDDIWDVVKYSDPQFRGHSTYSIEDITINGGEEYLNRDTYFSYNIENIQILDETNKITISLYGDVAEYTLVLNDLSAVMDTSTQTVLAYAWKNGSGDLRWFDGTISDNSASFILTNDYDNFIFVVFTSGTTSENASWDNFIKQTNDTVLVSSKVYSTSDFSWREKTSLMTLDLDDTSTFTIPTPFLGE